MARINTAGALSVGTTSGAGQSVNGLTGGGNTQTNITTKESTYMGGNPANVAAAGAVCMPNQAQKTVNLTNKTRQGIIYSGAVAADAWKQTAMSEFRGAYTTRPSIASSVVGSGNYNYGTCTVTCTPPADVAGICSVWVTPTPAGGSADWVLCNASNQYSFQAARNTTYTVYVKDINNCGANLEFRVTGILYNL